MAMVERCTPAESVAQPLLAVHGCSIQNKAHRQECLCYWRRRMVGAAKAMTAVSTNAKPLESAMATGVLQRSANAPTSRLPSGVKPRRSEEHTSELQSRLHLVCRLLLEKKKKKKREISHARDTES